VNNLEIVGGAILFGFAVGRLFGLISVPSVAGYVLLGAFLGDSFTGVISHTALAHLHVVGELALGAIAFAIGIELEWRTLRRIGRSVFPIVLLEALGANLMVTLGIWWFFDDLALALVLGAIAAATAPAATVLVIREMRAAGPLTSTLLAVVGMDDAIALILYAIAAAAASSLLGSTDVSLFAVLTTAGYEIGGSLLLGLGLGASLGWLVSRLGSREAVLSLTVGALILIEGLADQLHLSSLLVIMTLGAVMANIAPFPSRILREQVSSLAAPILIGFFVLAGAYLRVDLLPGLGWLGVVYLLARFAGKLGGAAAGSWLGQAPPAVRANIGFGLLSQVGIAIGLSLVVVAEFSPLGAKGESLALTVVNVLLGTTLVTELVGPVLVRRALLRAGEAGKLEQLEEEEETE